MRGWTALLLVPLLLADNIFPCDVDEANQCIGCNGVPEDAGKAFDSYYELDSTSRTCFGTSVRAPHRASAGINTATQGAIPASLEAGTIAAIVISALAAIWCITCGVVLKWYCKKEENDRHLPTTEVVAAVARTSKPAKVEVKVAPDLAGYDELDESTMGTQPDLDSPTEAKEIPIVMWQLVSAGELREYKAVDLKSVGEVAGEGSFKVVLKCETEDGPVALSLLKIKTQAHMSDTEKMDLTKAYRSNFLSEALYNIKLHLHTNIITLKGVCFDDLTDKITAVAPHLVRKDQHLYRLGLVFELATGSLYSSLYEERTKFTTSQKKRIMYGIINGLAHLHANAITHRDLKTPNILLGEDLTPKLCDFGTAQQHHFSETMMSTLHEGCGTLRYMAPEQLPKHHPLILNSPLAANKVRVTDKADLWAFGLVMCELFTTTPPWSERGSFDKLRRDKRSWIPPEARRFINDSQQDSIARRIVKQCLCFDKDIRPGASQVQLMLLDACWDQPDATANSTPSTPLASSALLPAPIKSSSRPISRTKSFDGVWTL